MERWAGILVAGLQQVLLTWRARLKTARPVFGSAVVSIVLRTSRQIDCSLISSSTAGEREREVRTLRKLNFENVRAYVIAWS